MISAAKRKMTKRILITALIILFLIPAIFLVWRAIEYFSDPLEDKTFLKPELKFSSIYVYGFTKDKIELKGDIILKNNLPFALKTDSVSYTLYMEDVKILQTTYRERLKLRARDTLAVTLPFLVLKKQLDSIGDILLKRGSDSVDYKSEYVFYTPSRFLRQWNYAKTKRGPAFHLLDIKLDKIEMNGLKLKGIFYSVNLIFKNENVFPVEIRDTEYFIYLGKELLTKGSKKEKLTFPAKKTTLVEFPANISYGHFAKMLVSKIPGANKQDYKLIIRFVIETKREKLDNTPTTITRTGPMEEVFDFNKSEK